MLGLCVSQAARYQTRLCWARPPPLLTSLVLHPRSCIYFRITSRSLATRPPTQDPTPQPPLKALVKSSILSQVLPATFANAPPTVSSFRKIVSLAKPEWKPLSTAIGLLLVSSSISMSVPFTVGKLIDCFSSTAPVRVIFHTSILTFTHLVCSNCLMDSRCLKHPQYSCWCLPWVAWPMPGDHSLYACQVCENFIYVILVPSEFGSRRGYRETHFSLFLWGSIIHLEMTLNCDATSAPTLSALAPFENRGPSPSNSCLIHLFFQVNV